MMSKKFIPLRNFSIKIFSILILTLPISAFSEEFSGSNVYQETNEGKTKNSDTKLFSGAAGINLGWIVKKEYGEQNQRKFTPEVLGFLYLSLSNDFYLRGALRGSYSFVQAQMPKSLKIEEYDIFALGDIAILYDWYVIPSLSIGGGADFRKVKFKSGDFVQTPEDKISTSETLGVFYAQLGVGVPLFDGLFVVEPFFRYLSVESDDRFYGWFGIEISVQIF